MPPAAAASSVLPGPASRGAAWADGAIATGVALVLVVAVAGLGGVPAVVMQFVAPAVFALGAAGLLRWGCGNATLHAAVLLPVPFLVYALASAAGWAPAPWLAWREWLLWLQAWMIFAVVLQTGPGAAGSRILVATLLGLGLANVFLAAYQRFADPGWLMLGRVQAPQFRGRASGLFGVPNSLACFLALLVPACLTILQSRMARPTVKVFSAWAAALLLVAIGLTISRGGWLALLAALGLWPLLGAQAWRRKLAGLVAVLAVLGLVLTAAYHTSAGVRKRVEPFLDGHLELSRPVLWRAGVEIWRESPVWGGGAASFNERFEPHRPARFLDNPRWVHNEYLNIAADYGAVGFCLWAGAGAAVLWLGWRAVRHARRQAGPAAPLLVREKFKLGLLLGLVAAGMHLVVDFHWRVPGLALAFAVVAGLLLRDDPRWQVPLPPRLRRTIAFAGVLLLVGFGCWRVVPIYRAEAKREEARRSIDAYARHRRGDIVAIVAGARAGLAQAVREDPANADAWSDLAYATIQGWRLNTLPNVALGRFAELAADRALAIHPGRAEFWLRRGEALDLQGGRSEQAEAAFRRATELAPNLPVTWFGFAFHLQRFPERTHDALRAVETCLALDPGYPAAESLRQQLVARR